MSPRSTRRTTALTAAPALLTLLVGWLGACSCSDSGPAKAPNVVVIVVDTLRRDHVSSYGYARPTTPNLDALASVADRYERCWSTAPWTLPSHASLFTGEYPFQHGAHSAKDASGVILDAIPLAPEEQTLAEALSAEGYDTAAFVANAAYLRRGLGLDQGFGTYVVERRKGVDMNALALAWLDEREQRLANATPEQARPFFLFLNYMDAHRPYNATPLEGERAGALPSPSPERDLLDRLYVEVFTKDGPPPPELVQQVVEQYDLGIANADRALGELIAELRTRGLFDDTLIVVTSDHGEFLGEHDLVEHSKDVYEEALRVPLVVKRAGQSAGRVLSERTSLVHLASLIASQLPSALSRRLAREFPEPPGEDALLAENAYSRVKDLAQSYGARFLRERVVLYVGGTKFILSSDGKSELYDLESDPTEQHNLLETQPELAKTMEERLREILKASARDTKVSASPALTPEDEDALRKLGYTDGSDQGASEPRAPQTKPKHERDPAPSEPPKR